MTEACLWVFEVHFEPELQNRHQKWRKVQLPGRKALFDKKSWFLTGFGHTSQNFVLTHS